MSGVEWGEVSADVLTSNQIKVMWNLTDGSATRTAIKIWIRKVGGSWDGGKQLSPNAPNYTYTGLAKDTKYDFCVRAYYKYNDDQAWDTDYVDTYLYGVSTSSITSVDLKADASSGNVSVSWTTNPRASTGTTTLYWRDQSEVDNKKSELYSVDEVLIEGWHGKTGITGTSFTVNSLKGGRWYTFYIRQYFNESNTYSEIIKKVWVDCLSDLKYSIDTARSAALTWSPNDALTTLSFGGLASDAPKNGATVRIWKQEGNNNAPWVEIANLPPSTTSYTATSLTPATRYRFCVRIHDWNYPQKYYNVEKWDGDNYTPWFSMPNYAVPKPATSLRATFDKATMRVTLQWTNNPVDISRPIDDIRIYRSIDSGTFEEVGTTTGESYIETVTPGHSYQYMVQPFNLDGWGQATYSNTITVAPLAPLAPTDLVAERVFGGVSLSWTNNEEDGKPYSRIRIERSANGSAWSLIAEALGTIESYTDTTAQDNNTYRYRIRSTNSGGSSDYVISNEICMPPGPPDKPTVRRTTDGYAYVSWTSSARNTTAQEVRSKGRESGEQPTVTVLPTSRSYLDTSAITDESVAYQVRSVRQEGTSEDEIFYSEWSEWSSWCLPWAAPNAPTLRSPIEGSTVAFQVKSGETINTNDVSFEIEWRHNPIDGSEQTKAEIQISCDGRVTLTGTKSIIGSTHSVEVRLSDVFADLSAITEIDDSGFIGLSWKIKVRTMGAKNEYSPWSERSVKFRRIPSVIFETPDASYYFDADKQPIDQARLSSYPMEIILDPETHRDGLSYSTLNIIRDGVLIETLHNSGSYWSHPLSGGTKEKPFFILDSKSFAPENHAIYTFEGFIRTKSGLETSTSIEVLTDFEEPKHSSLRISCDPDRGYITLEPHVDRNDEDNRAVSSLDVWRVVDGRAKLIAQGLANGEEFVDRFAPVNKDFVYRLAAYSDQGVYRTVDHPGSLKTDYCFIYFGDNFERIARGRLAPNESVTTNRSRQTQVDYAGRTFPVVYDGGGIDQTHSVNVIVSGAEEIEEFRWIAENERVYYKSLDGYAFMATAQVTIATHDALPWSYKQVGVELIRIDGDPDEL